jgi:CRP-like cAMP-binding protein
VKGNFFGCSLEVEKSQFLHNFGKGYEKLSDFDYIATSDSQLVFLDQKSIERIIFCANLLEAREDCLFLLSNSEYFVRFNCSEKIRETFVDEVSPLLHRIFVKKGETLVKLGQNINSLYIIREGDLKCLIKQSDIMATEDVLNNTRNSHWANPTQTKIDRTGQGYSTDKQDVMKNKLNQILKDCLQSSRLIDNHGQPELDPTLGRTIGPGKMYGFRQFFSPEKYSKFKIIGESLVSTVLKINPEEMMKS